MVQISQNVTNTRSHKTTQDAEIQAAIDLQRVKDAAPLLLKRLEEQTNWFIATMLPDMPEPQKKIWWDEIGNPSRAAIKAAKEDSK